MSGAGLSVTAGLRRAARDRAGFCAVVDGARRFTWREHAERVARLAAGLRALGATSGERVAILADGSHFYVEAYHAVPWAGAILAPVNSRFAQPEMLEILTDSSPRVLLADADHAHLARGGVESENCHVGCAAATSRLGRG